MRFSITILLFVACLAPVAARAERIELKGGDRLTGQWLDSTPETVRFVSKFGSVVRIPRDEVLALYEDDGTVKAMPQPIADDLPKPAIAPVNIADGEKKEQAPEKGFVGARWKSQVGAGAGLQTGNTSNKSFNADYKTKAKWERDRANLDLDYNWQESEGERTQDNRSLEGNYDRFLPASVMGDDRWYVNGNGNLRQDKVADLELRSVLGVGLGRQFYETEDTYFSASVGPSWLRQAFYSGDVQSSLAARWNVDYRQKFYENLFELFHKHSLYLPSDDVSAYLFDADSGVKIPLREGFSLTGEWTLNVNNDPGEGIDRQDSAYTLKLGYEW